ncbi:hypothetical protein GZH46_02179, partial [Fragariocoptes setiger]
FESQTKQQQQQQKEQLGENNSNSNNNFVVAKLDISEFVLIGGGSLSLRTALVETAPHEAGTATAAAKQQTTTTIQTLQVMQALISCSKKQHGIISQVQVGTITSNRIKTSTTIMCDEHYQHVMTMGPIGRTTHYPVDELDHVSWRTGKCGVKSDFYGGAATIGTNYTTYSNYNGNYYDGNNYNGKINGNNIPLIKLEPQWPRGPNQLLAVNSNNNNNNNSISNTHGIANSNTNNANNQVAATNRRHGTQVVQSAHIAAALREQLLDKPVIPFDCPTTSLARINRYRRSTHLTRTSSMYGSPTSAPCSLASVVTASLAPGDTSTLRASDVRKASVLSKPRAPSIVPPESSVASDADTADAPILLGSCTIKPVPPHQFDTQSLSIPPPTPYRSSSVVPPDSLSYNGTDTDTGLYNIGTLSGYYTPTKNTTNSAATLDNSTVHSSSNNNNNNNSISGFSRITSVTKSKTVQQLANIKRLFTSSKCNLASKKSLFNSNSSETCESPPNQGSRASINSNFSDTTLVSASGLATATSDAKLLARIEELEEQLRIKEKEMTNLRLENMSAAYTIDNLRSQVEKLVRDNLLLRLKKC